MKYIFFILIILIVLGFIVLLLKDKCKYLSTTIYKAQNFISNKLQILFTKIKSLCLHKKK